jgi:threonine dehydrogenase-like Zn-dependent dehydrogenase
MRAVVFHDIGDVRLDHVDDPKLEKPTDAIVRLTACAICGTDLHMVRATLPGMKSGTILGHEGVAKKSAPRPSKRHLFDVEATDTRARPESSMPNCSSLR